jgi:hypothetical protein
VLRGTSHGVPSLAVLMFTLQLSSSVQKAMRPTSGFSRLTTAASNCATPFSSFTGTVKRALVDVSGTPIEDQGARIREVLARQ